MLVTESIVLFSLIITIKINPAGEKSLSRVKKILNE